MTTQEKLIRNKLSLLELAEYLKNVSEPAARFSRRLVSPSHRPSGKWHDSIHVVEEQSVVPRTSPRHSCI